MKTPCLNPRNGLNNKVKNLLITLGSKGVFYCTPHGHGMVPAFKVKAVDTTAAGDTFIGALASQLDNDLSNVADALVYAQRASSLTVQKMGAMPSIPTGESRTCRIIAADRSQK